MPASGAILSRGLQHSTRSSIDRDVGPGRRNSESLNSCKIDPTHLPAVGCDIAKMVLRSNSPNPSLLQSFSSVHSDRRDFKVDDSSDAEQHRWRLAADLSAPRPHQKATQAINSNAVNFRLLHCPITGRFRPGLNENGTAVLIAHPFLRKANAQLRSAPHPGRNPASDRLRAQVSDVTCLRYTPYRCRSYQSLKKRSDESAVPLGFCFC